MSETLALPVLPLDDTVVLPTMVVPLDTSAAEARAAISAAQMSAAVPGAADATPQRPARPPAGGQVLGAGHARRRRADRPAAQRRARRGDPRPGPGADRRRAPPAPARPCGSRGPWWTSPPPARAPRSWPASTAAWPPPSCRSGARGRSSTCCSGSPTRPRWPTAPATPAT